MFYIVHQNYKQRTELWVSLFPPIYFFIYLFIKKYKSFIEQPKTRLFPAKRFRRISPLFNGKIFKKKKEKVLLSEF